jgi:hypothetical protein
MNGRNRAIVVIFRFLSDPFDIGNTTDNALNIALGGEGSKSSKMQEAARNHN